MGRCSNDVLMSVIGIKQATKKTEIKFNVLTDVDRCMFVNTRDYIASDGTAVYNKFRIPEDVFNCLAEGCRNSGTLMLQGAADTPMSATFQVKYDATEFYQGLVTYYVDFPEAGTYTVTTTISDINNPTQTNSDAWTQEITVTEAGFRPIVVDMSKVPTTVTGNGWIENEAGATMKVTITAADETVIGNYGISSIYLYDSIEDFEVNDTVTIRCLSEITADLTIDAVDASCFGAGYDEDSTSIEYTITGSAIEPNYWKLNPTASKGDLTEYWMQANDDREVKSITIDGIDYGYVQFPDMYVEECGFVGAQISEGCNTHEKMLTRVNSPVPLDITEREFIVLDGTTTDSSFAGMILFNSDLIGQRVTVTYPKRQTVRHTFASDEAVNERRVRMIIPFKTTGGQEYMYQFNHVLITSFPMMIGIGEDTTFSFTISIQRDKDGRFFNLFEKTN